MQVFLLHRLRIGLGEDEFQRVVIENRFAVHALDQLPGRLTLAKAGHVDASAVFQVRFFQRRLKIGSWRLKRDFDFAAGLFLHRIFHVFSSQAWHPLPIIAVISKNTIC